MHRYIIKPCVPNPIELELHTTSMESLMFPNFYKQVEMEKSAEAQLFWNIVHNIFQSEAIWGKWDLAAVLAKTQLSCMDCARDDARFVKHNMDEWTYVALAQWLVSNQYDVAEQTIDILIECWKYLVRFKWSIDLMSVDYRMADIKFYGKLREKKWDLKDEYNKDNYKWTVLENKFQWIFYPAVMSIMLDTDQDMEFDYIVVDKCKKVKYQVLKCKVDVVRAREVLKEKITDFFRLALINWNLKEYTKMY